MLKFVAFFCILHVHCVPIKGNRTAHFLIHSVLLTVLTLIIMHYTDDRIMGTASQFIDRVLVQ